MSIINEALKKTQVNLNNLRGKPVTVVDDRVAAGQKAWQPPAAHPAQTFTPAPSSAPVAAPAPQLKRTSAKRWYLIVFAEILGLGLAVWVLFIFQPQLFHSSFQPKKFPAVRKNIPPPAQSSPAATQPQSVPALSVAPPPEIKFPMGASAKNLVLNGIMMDQNKMVALINDEIYEVGDYIGDHKVTEITLDRVELRDDGNNVTILEVKKLGR